jgi:hypothetical protein
LKEDLKGYAALMESDPKKFAPVVLRRLEYWHKDPNLTPVRDANALVNLPEDERKRWEQLWNEVEALRQCAGAPK